ncbi:host nuclease inhibitor GamL [Pantoea ananatis]|uniref:host nuclease inhibitor GamL n=1 Tax=Pantoea ananas TaxID=553 RepID=UPI001B30C206|nr:host nuclease inhibitor GamL [Pantoea ananatis]
MSAYAVHERIEEARWQQHDASVKKDEWIRERAETLKEQWPVDFATLRRAFGFSMPGIDTDFAQDAFAKMVDEICVKQAEIDWRGKEWLGEDWTP